MALVAVAGPLTNFAIALVVGWLLAHGSWGSTTFEVLAFAFSINVTLGVFNLLPVPPLDGGHVVGHLVPHRWRGAWESFARYAPLLLLAVLMLGRGIPGIYVPIQFLYGAVRQIAVAIA
jgi:Zn-dependent protease